MLHPTVRLVLWGATVAATQVLPLAWLLGVSAIVFPLVTRLAQRHFLVLLRRTRWLLASIIVLFALATPGVLLLPELGSLGPSQEGIALGLTHLLRLALVLAALAGLLEFSGLDDLVAGLYGLLRPLAPFGLDRGRVALRIMLVLRYVEEAPRGGHWRDWLEHAHVPGDASAIRLRAAPMRRADYVVLACLGVMAVVVLWRWM